MMLKRYLISLPERVLRSVLGLGAGAVREVGEVALPDGVRRTQLYQNVVDTTLRYLIKRVGGVQGVYEDADVLPDDFLARRSAGNVVELAGIVAFRASPVWVLAALSDACGVGRQLIPEIAAALKAQGLLDRDTTFTTVDQVLDGLERTSSRLAAAVNTPPLDVAGLRDELRIVREEARALQPSSLPSAETLRALWMQIADESARQGRSVFETSSLLALSAAQRVPDGLRWASSSARVGAVAAGQFFGAPLLVHYRHTLGEIRAIGFATFAARQFRPYVRAAVQQFSPEQATLTERLLDRVGRGTSGSATP